MPRFSPSESTVRNVATQFGAIVTEIGTTGSGHRFAVIALAGSDWRAQKNLATDVRKLLRGM